MFFSVQDTVERMKIKGENICKTQTEIKDLSPKYTKST